MKTFYLTVLSILAFAGNSVLCRIALASDQIDPMSFSAIRLFSGAITLVLLVLIFNRATTRNLAGTPLKPAINWQLGSQHLIGAASLLAYAVLFSFAYIELSTGMGALLLFTSVQVCMLLWAVISRENISALKWFGSSLAIVGLVVLLAPSATSAAGNEANNTSWQYSLMMIASGCAWGIYTINGRSSTNPLRDTTLNFCLSLPLALLGWFLYQSNIAINAQGFILAALSGAVASAIGYAIWYAVLPKLSTPVAASAQLMAPLVAALAGAVLVQEAISLQFMLAFALVSTGILLTVLTFNQPTQN